MINLTDLRFIDALGRAGSLSAAARLLNVSPPALSMRLKRLEDEFGVRLVERSSRRMRLTSEGEAPYPGAPPHSDHRGGVAHPGPTRWPDDRGDETEDLSRPRP